MNIFALDASALVKHFSHEAGSLLVDHLFANVVPTRLSSLMLGTAEVLAALVRKRKQRLARICHLRNGSYSAVQGSS